MTREELLEKAKAELEALALMTAKELDAMEARAERAEAALAEARGLLAGIETPMTPEAYFEWRRTISAFLAGHSASAECTCPNGPHVNWHPEPCPRAPLTGQEKP